MEMCIEYADIEYFNYYSYQEIVEQKALEYIITKNPWFRIRNLESVVQSP